MDSGSYICKDWNVGPREIVFVHRRNAYDFDIVLWTKTQYCYNALVIYFTLINNGKPTCSVKSHLEHFPSFV